MAEGEILKQPLSLAYNPYILLKIPYASYCNRSRKSALKWTPSYARTHYYNRYILHSTRTSPRPGFGPGWKGSSPGFRPGLLPSSRIWSGFELVPRPGFDPGLIQDFENRPGFGPRVRILTRISPWCDVSQKQNFAQDWDQDFFISWTNPGLIH